MVADHAQAPEEQKINYGMETLRGLFSTWVEGVVQQQQTGQDSARQEPPDTEQQPDGYTPDGHCTPVLCLDIEL